MTIADARSLTFHEYTAMLTIWNGRQADPKGGTVEPPHAETVRADLARLSVDPRMTGAV